MGTIIDKRQKTATLSELKPGVEFTWGSSNKEFGVVLDKDGLVYPSNDELSEHGIPASTPMIPFFNINDSLITWKTANTVVTVVTITHEIHNL